MGRHLRGPFFLALDFTFHRPAHRFKEGVFKGVVPGVQQPAVDVHALPEPAHAGHAIAVLVEPLASGGDDSTVRYRMTQLRELYGDLIGSAVWGMMKKDGAMMKDGAMKKDGMPAEPKK